MPDQWLFCDFHIHTSVSDGAHPPEEIVDLYGSHGFDVIAITDHIIDSQCAEERQTSGLSRCAIPKEEFQDYLHRLWREKKRAWREYNMLLIPGAEITNNTGQYHILALDIKEYILPDLTVAEIVAAVHAQEGIAIACHPHYKEEVELQPVYAHLWENHQEYKHLFDAWEVANRDSLFDVVGLRKFKYIANSDLHDKSQIYSWKTMLNCERNTEAVKETIRKNKRIGICLFRNHET
jgi:predicted metal-dependent phosphoesterase TrpH